MFNLSNFNNFNDYFFGITKIFFVILSILYVIFALIVVKQATSMSKSITDKFNPLLITFSFVHLVFPRLRPKLGGVFTNK